MKRRFVLGGAFICLLWFVGSCGKPASKIELTEDRVDSIVRSATDSLYANSTYARQLLQAEMSQATDSFAYYTLLSVYAKACHVSSRFDSTLYHSQAIIRFCDKQPASPRIHDLLSVAYNLSGNVWIQRAVADSALYYYQHAYQHRLQGTDVSFLPDLCINLADACRFAGKYAEDAMYYRRALFLCDSLGLSDERKHPIYAGLGQVYMEMRDFDLSNYYFEMAGRLLPLMNAYERWNYFVSRTNHFYYKKDYVQAQYYCEQSLRTLDAYPEMIFERHLSMINQGELYMLNDKLDSAQFCLDESYRYFSKMNHRAAIYYIETQRIELALKQGDIAGASKLIARTVPDGLTDMNAITVRNQYLQHYYERSGNYKKAYEYQQLNLNLDDSTRNERIRTHVAELDMRYRQDTIVMRRELVITQQSGKMKALRLTAYLWAIGCLAVIAVSFSVYWLMKKKRLFLQQRHLNQISRLRMENIRNHISPHFTFNVLNHEISKFKGSETERSGLVNLVKLLRKSLELTEKLSVSLREELDFVQTYLALEQGKLGEEFTLTVEVDETLDAEQILIPSMIIQIPVENAIKHGLAGIERAQRLSIVVVGQESGIRITITDNGRGYLPQSISATRGTGTGLKVLYQTIQLLNARNREEKIRFEIINLADRKQIGTCVSVWVPSNYIYDL